MHAHTIFELIAAIVAVAIAIWGAVWPPVDKTHKKWFVVVGTLGVIALVIGAILNDTALTSAERETAKAQGATVQAQNDLTSAVNTASSAIENISKQNNGLAKQNEELTAQIQNLNAQLQVFMRRELTLSPAPVHVAHFSFTQRKVASSDVNLPIALQVIIQTDEPIHNPIFKIKTDGKIAKGSFFVTGQGAMMNVRWGNADDNTSFVLSFSFPEFTPESPIVVTLLSPTDIHATGLEDLRFKQ